MTDRRTLIAGVALACLCAVAACSGLPNETLTPVAMPSPSGAPPVAASGPVASPSPATTATANITVR